MPAGTIAEFFIEEGRIRVELEIGLENLPVFRNLLPDEIYEISSHATAGYRGMISVVSQRLC